MTTPRTLDEMALYRTSYEVVLIYKGRTTRLGFTERKTKGALLNMARANGKLLLATLDAADVDTEWTYSKAKGVGFGTARIDFSGRTERDCASEIARAA